MKRRMPQVNCKCSMCASFFISCRRARVRACCGLGNDRWKACVHARRRRGSRNSCICRCEAQAHDLAHSQHHTLNTNLNSVAALSGQPAAGAPAPGADPAAVFEGVRARLAGLGAEAARARGDANALRGQLAAAAERHGAAMADAERRRQARARSGLHILADVGGPRGRPPLSAH